jgi:hypothetical protein
MRSETNAGTVPNGFLKPCFCEGICVMANENENLSAGETVAAEPVLRKNTPRNEFIPVWQACATAREVGEKLNMSPATASSTASKYRSEGYNLKRMPKGGGVKLDPETTYALLAKINGTSVEAEKAAGEKLKAEKAARVAAKAAKASA